MQLEIKDILFKDIPFLGYEYVNDGVEVYFGDTPTNGRGKIRLRTSDCPDLIEIISKLFEANEMYNETVFIDFDGGYFSMLTKDVVR